ncbi:DUF4142 domain-containing protein [Paucihalobacter ruber]|uniref:DUF4142 domain-containing protein n=1 Tax=Paucihalobacter ruber TaxID=2567861 RepID=A0A506PGH6_9FLAO|nr:DUF4142 domain-containing protein [Paucihalobacter ruber]TPV31440.1 DUF4142 domain-containing protein [Paucihalobacter ruber]
MRTLTPLKEIIIQIILTTFIVTLVSCGPAQNTEEPGLYNQDNSNRMDNYKISNDSLSNYYRTDNDLLGNDILIDNRSANERINYRLNAQQQKRDSQFLAGAATTNLKQIKAGKLAQKNGKTEEVRELGKMMEDAHQKSQKDLTALAQRKNIQIPTFLDVSAQSDYDEFFYESKDNFDKVYTDMMINLHEESIEDFEKASTESNDTDIKNWAVATLPDLRKHLEHSKECQKKSSHMMHLKKN